MSYTKIVYQLLIAVRLLAFIPGLVLTILSVLNSDDNVDISYGLIAFTMGGIHFLFMLGFGCRHIKSLGVFLEESTLCLSLWIYFPEMAVIALLAYFCTITEADAQKLAMGATSAFALAFLILLFVVCGQRVFRKDIPEERESLLHKDARDSKGRKQTMKQTFQKSSRKRENHNQPEAQSRYERPSHRPNGLKPNGVHAPPKGPPPIRPKPRSPKLQDLVRSNNIKMGAAKRGHHREPPIYELPHMDAPATNYLGNSTNLSKGMRSAQGPPLRYGSSYLGPSHFQNNWQAPPLGYSGHSIPSNAYSNGQIPPLQHVDRVAERTRSSYGGRTSYAPSPGYFDIQPDY